MKRRPFRKIVLLSLAALVLVLAVGAYGWRDTWLRVAIETVGSRLTGTRVQVAVARLAPFAGHSEVRELVVANPPGFTTGQACRIERVRVAFAPRSLGQERLVIRDLVIERPTIHYEPATGTSNCDQILQALARALAPDPRDPRASRQVQIDRFVLSGAVIRWAAPAGTGAGGHPELRLPRLELRDLGRDGTLSDTLQTLTAAVTAAVAGELAAQAPGVADTRRLWSRTAAELRTGARRLAADAGSLWFEAHPPPPMPGTASR